MITSEKNDNLESLMKKIKSGKDLNVKKWIDPEKSKAKFVKKLYLLGEILIDEDLCEACSVRYIDDFDSHDLDDSYDYKKLLKVRENW